jgi:DNA helicase II / ATP-dependent DNA helicase PcrA
MSNFIPSRYNSDLFEAFSIDRTRIAVNAGPGTGKSKHLEEQSKLLKVSERSNSLVLSFNVSICTELQERLPGEMTIINFHKYGKRIVEDSLRIKTRVNKGKYTTLIKELSGVDEWDFISECNKALEMCQANLVNPDDSTEFWSVVEAYDLEELPDMQSIVSQAHRKGLALAKSIGEISFGDMLSLPYYLNLRIPTYGNVLVDEAQDLSAAQTYLTINSANSDSRIMAVGDPRQAIYGFAGAKHNSFELIKEAIDGTEMPLSITYRCPKSHVDFLGTIYTGLEAAEWAKPGTIENLTYDKLLLNVKAESGDMVLSRVTAPLVGMCFDLLEEGTPAKVKGRDIEKGLMSLAKAGDRQTNSYADLMTGVKAVIEKERELLIKRPNDTKKAKYEALLDKGRALSTLHRKSIDDGITEVRQLERWITNFFDDDTRGCVTLSTVHKAKGLEAENVFILDPSKMPHPMAKTPGQMIQEQNIRWVAYSRSKNYLGLSAPRPKSDDDQDF